jgi:hypothetical protein
MGKDEFIKYFNDPSHVLKYFAYRVALNSSDSLGFELLKIEMGDTVKMNYPEFSLVNHPVNFDELLVKQYEWYIKTKYHDGFTGTTNDGTYQFYNCKNKKIWRAKEAALQALLDKYWVRTKHLATRKYISQ